MADIGGSEGEDLNDLKVELESQIFKLWEEVLQTVNQVLKADRKFGFDNIEKSLNPTIPEILHGLSTIEFLLSAFVDMGVLEHDGVRRALNAKQCVLHIRRMATALDGNNEAEYKEAIKLLENQAQF